MSRVAGWSPYRDGRASWRIHLALSCAVLVAMPQLAKAEADRSSARQFMYLEGLRGGAVAPPPRVAPHRSAPTFRRILMERGMSGSRQASDRKPSRPSTAQQGPTRTIAVFGDRFGQALASGLTDTASSDTIVSVQTSDDAGLTRGDFAAWLESLRSRLAKPDHADLAIVMLGSNDRQPLDDAGTSVVPADPRWQALYAARADAVASTFAKLGMPLIWVGLPSVHDEEISADFVRINGIVRDRVARAGGTYVDSWEAFADETGRYSPIGPDLEGDTVKLRKADGFGFTIAGSRKLASFVEGDIKRIETSVLPSLRRAEPAEAIVIDTARDFDQALQIDVNAQIRREAGLPSETPSAATASAGPGARPVAGPVIPLTAPLAPDGQLAGASTRQFPGALPRTADNGDAPKPGRADDFGWPRP